MPSSRLAVLVLLSSCAAWETATPNYTAPPAEGPAPSHYAPPPTDPAPPTATPEPPVETPPPATKGPPGDHVAIASVQLANDCPDPPAPAAAGSAPAANRPAGPAGRSLAASEDVPQSQSKMRRPGFGDCDQSTVQIAVRSDRPGKFRVEAVRILDGARQRVAGSSTLRAPTRWRDDSSTYEAWSEAVVAETDLQISYKLGALDLKQGERLVGPDFNTFFGPFLLELDVSIDGRRQTIRSSPFARESPNVAIQT